MSTALSYADAVKVLGGDRPNKVVEALDRLTGGALLLVSATGSALALSLFDAKSEFYRLTEQLVSGLVGRVREKGRAERGEQVAAAHSVIVVAAFFDVMATVPLPFDFDDLNFTPSDGFTSALLRTPVPIPAPHRPYEKSIEELQEFYDDTAKEVVKFLAGLEVWERLDDRERREVERVVLGQVGAQAIVTYESLVLYLARDFPEVAFWANLIDHQATRTGISELKTALAGIAKVLSELAASRVPDEHLLRLARYHEGVLRDPLLPELLDGVRLPVIADAYVNPHYRVVGDEHNNRIADEKWWGGRPVRTDLQEFLIGHLTTPAATQAPLLVLGQPGSGKSMLTKVLAASLSKGEFVVVRVPLREVSADRDVLAQIEQGLRLMTADHVTWRDFVRSAGGDLPVVLLDGFDELLQATRVSKSDYLDSVARFQQREALLGHKVVVVVTSRVSVADRARPVDGMVSLLLEPFNDEQIEQWLTPWRRANRIDLSLDDVRPHMELARQPLLLLLLAIYDRTEKRLAQHGDVFGRTELYERLLVGFSRREVLREHAHEPDDAVAVLVEEQLVRLSVAAFAMFNRGRQWVSEEELNADLAVLLARAPSARVVIGSFYFIHTDQAFKNDVKLHTYEFMHPTFGEYFIARMAVLEVLALGEGRRDGDDFVHALLSFAMLTERGPVADFVGNIVAGLGERGAIFRRTLFSLFHEALLPRASFLSDYEPGSMVVPARCATYSANLCVLLALTPPEEVTAEELFPDVEEPVAEWSKIASLWMSQLSAEGWRGLVEALELSRSWRGDRRALRISRRSGDEQELDLHWTHRFGPSERKQAEAGYTGWTRLDLGAVSAELEFLCRPEGDTVSHALAPFRGKLGSMVTAFHSFGKTMPVSAAQALVSLWLKADGGASSEELVPAYNICLMWAVHGFAPHDIEVRDHFRLLFLNQLQRLRYRLPESTIDATVETMLGANGKEAEELLALTRDICPGLLH